jgi:hypothetical protein
MGAVYDDLPGHEGFALCRLADGSHTTDVTTGFAGWTAGCGCGWRDDHLHSPDEDGYEATLDRWDDRHASPLLERAVPAMVENLVRQTRRAVAQLAETRPAAAASLLDRIDKWSDSLRERMASRSATGLTVQQRLDAVARQARHGPRIGR